MKKHARASAARRHPAGTGLKPAALGREGGAFAVVGSLGFLAHAALIELLVRTSALDPYPAWFPAFAAAVVLTYLLNRTWTFRERAGPDRGREFARYAALQGLGAALNNAVYGMALWLHPLFRAHPTLALALGSGVAMAANYLSTRHLAFTARPGRRAGGGGPADPARTLR